MANILKFNSPEYSAFHEAGHALVALDVGARIVEMELYRDVPRAYGRTQVQRTAQQGARIALGGFAAEYLLFSAGRAAKEDGTLPLEPEFVDFAFRNASNDYETFWTCYKGSLDPNTVGLSQKDMDYKFMSFAIGCADNQLSLIGIEALAQELLKKDKLTGNEIRETLRR